MNDLKLFILGLGLIAIVEMLALHQGYKTAPFYDSGKFTYLAKNGEN